MQPLGHRFGNPHNEKPDESESTEHEDGFHSLSPYESILSSIDFSCTGLNILTQTYFTLHLHNATPAFIFHKTGPLIIIHSILSKNIII